MIHQINVNLLPLAYSFENSGTTAYRQQRDVSSKDQEKSH